jgi:sulfonate transport system permease protein
MKAIASGFFPRRLTLPLLSLQPRLRGLTAFISPLALLLAWAWLAQLRIFPEQIVVPPSVVLDAFRELLDSGELQMHVSISLYRLAAGFAIGSVTGLLFGVLMALSRQVEIYFGPLFQALRQIPTLALIPMFVLFFGIDETLKIVILVKATFFPVAIAAYDGVKNIPRGYLEVGRVYRLGHASLLRRVVLPATVPPVLTGIRISLGRAWLVLVAVELLAADSGIGQMMEMGRQMLRLDVVMVGVIITGVIGFALDKGFRLLERFLLRWKYKAV